MILPLSVDKTPNGDIKKRAEVGEEGYGENIEYFLVLSPTRDGVHVEYVGEDDNYLDDSEIDTIVQWDYTPSISPRLPL